MAPQAPDKRHKESVLYFDEDLEGPPKCDPEGTQITSPTDQCCSQLGTLQNTVLQTLFLNMVCQVLLRALTWSRVVWCKENGSHARRECKDSGSRARS